MSFLKNLFEDTNPYKMKVYTSPTGQKHTTTDFLPSEVTVTDKQKYFEERSKLGKPILVYFVLATPERNWMSWVMAAVSLQPAYEEIHVVVQCRNDMTPADRAKSLFDAAHSNCIVHIFTDDPVSPQSGEGKLFGGAGEDPWCGEYRGFELLHQLALKHPTKVVAYGQAKGISRFQDYDAACEDPSVTCGHTVIKNVERAMDTFAFLPQVTSVGYHSSEIESKMSEDEGDTRAHWFNFFFARASMVIDSGAPDKTTKRHYYEGHYLINRKTMDDLKYNMKPCPRMVVACNKHLDWNTNPNFPNIGLDYNPGANEFTPIKFKE